MPSRSSGLPALAAFRQRLVVRTRLEPLGRHESADYLVHQLRLAGGRPNSLFTDEALDVLARACNGVPRLLNQAAHQALRLTCEAGNPAVDVEAAVEALALLGLDATAGGEEVAADEGPAVPGQTVLPLGDVAAEADGERRPA